MVSPYGIASMDFSRIPNVTIRYALNMHRVTEGPGCPTTECMRVFKT